MEIIKKNLVLISVVFMTMSDYILKGIASYTVIGLVVFSLLFLFTCIQNPQLKYFRKASKCFNIGFSVSFWYAILLLLLNSVSNYNNNSDVNSLLNDFFTLLPRGLSRLISLSILSLILAFFIPIFFKTKVDDREDILDV